LLNEPVPQFPALPSHLDAGPTHLAGWICIPPYGIAVPRRLLFSDRGSECVLPASVVEENETARVVVDWCKITFRTLGGYAGWLHEQVKSAAGATRGRGRPGTPPTNPAAGTVKPPKASPYSGYLGL
jgi:hypothetical protein